MSSQLLIHKLHNDRELVLCLTHSSIEQIFDEGQFIIYFIFDCTGSSFLFAGFL